MSKIISKRVRHKVPEYLLVFGDPAQGCLAFDCDEEGRVDQSKFNPTQQDAWIKAIQRDPGVVMCFPRKWVEPAVLECDCGSHVELSDPLDNFCECGAVYNMSGQRVIQSNQCEEY